MVAMDAAELDVLVDDDDKDGPTPRDLAPKLMERELCKSFCAFSSALDHISGFASGHWGCGHFGGYSANVPGAGDELRGLRRQRRIGTETYAGRQRRGGKLC